LREDSEFISSKLSGVNSFELLGGNPNPIWGNFPPIGGGTFEHIWDWALYLGVQPPLIFYIIFPKGANEFTPGCPFPLFIFGGRGASWGTEWGSS